MSEPDRICPDVGPKKTAGDRIRSVKRAFFTKGGLIGNYNYGFLFRPNLPFMKKSPSGVPFYGLDDRVPVLLSLLLGLQHALAMLAGVVSVPIVVGGAANLGPELTRYLVSAALITCGFLSMVQITRFHIHGTPYYIGTGLVSVLGTSFVIIPVALGAFEQIVAGPKDEVTGLKLPCPDGYGAVIGTSMVCAFLEIGLSFMPPGWIKLVFPPVVTGPTVMLVGVKLIGSGFKNWLGGVNCANMPATGLFSLCPDINAPKPLPWGSAELVGLGFSVFITIILAEKFGSPIMKSTSIIVGLLTGCIIAAATGYFSDTNINKAPVISFIWLHTFKLSVYPPLILPMLAVYIILACEAIGDISATCDVSRLDVKGKLFDSRIQGGLLSDGISGIISGLATITPVATYAQNNGVIALTRCANRKAGYACCLFLIIMGIFSKFAASLVAIPPAVLGGMTTFLFCAVAVSGMSITATMPFTRRNRFILTASLSVGYGATLAPKWFDHFFTYSDGGGLQGLIDAVNLIMETGFAVTAFLAIILNLLLDDETEDDDGLELTSSNEVIRINDSLVRSAERSGVTELSTRNVPQAEISEKML